MATPAEVASRGASPLLEREDTLGQLSEALVVAGSGEGRVVLLGGEAGVGKTALVQRFSRDHLKNVRLLTGACDPPFTPRPLDPFLDVAEMTGGELHECVAGAAHPYEVTAALVAELSGQLSQTQGSSVNETARALRVARAMV